MSDMIEKIKSAYRFLRGPWLPEMEKAVEERRRQRIEDNAITYHYEDNIPICQIQLAAKVIREVICDGVFRKNLKHVDCPIPLELNGDWENLRNYKRNYILDGHFFIETPKYGKIQYEYRNNIGIANLEINLFLKTAQDTLKKMSEGTAEASLQEADSLANAFTLINNGIGLFFFYDTNERDVFDWSTNYHPCYYDRRHILNFRGHMMPEVQIEVDEAKLYLVKKYMLRDFAMLTKYITFWVSLLDVATFPALSGKQRKAYSILMRYLLDNYANIYVYDIVAENNPVFNSNRTDIRKSESNTTRLKIFFTDKDDVPQLLRLDLPHVDHPYVHVNHHVCGRDVNEHIPISDDEETKGQYDGLFDALIEALRLYNFYSISNRHSSVSEDKQVFREMAYWTAMYNYAVAAKAYLYLEEECEIYEEEFVKENRETLINMLIEDGFDREDLKELNPYDLFEFADESIKGFNLIP